VVRSRKEDVLVWLPEITGMGLQSPKSKESKAVEGDFQLLKAEFEFAIMKAKRDLGDKCDESLQNMYLWDSLGHAVRHFLQKGWTCPDQIDMPSAMHVLAEEHGHKESRFARTGRLIRARQAAEETPHGWTVRVERLIG